MNLAQSRWIGFLHKSWGIILTVAHQESNWAKNVHIRKGLTDLNASES